MAKLNPLLQMDKETFITSLKSDAAWLKENTIKHIAEALKHFNLSEKTISTLEGYSKPNLKKELENYEKPLSPVTIQKTSSKNGGASVLVSLLNDLKLLIHSKELNPKVKEWAELAIDKLIAKVDDKEKLENMGTFGYYAIVIATFLDTILDFEKIREKIQQKIEERQKAQEEQLNNDKH